MCGATENLYGRHPGEVHPLYLCRCVLGTCTGMHECDPETCGAAWHYDRHREVVVDRRPYGPAPRDPMDFDPLLDEPPGGYPEEW